MNPKGVVWSALARPGVGRLTSALARGRLLILCYHGFSFRDEHLFRPKLFMTADLFEQRLDWLRRNRFVVLGLDEALKRLWSGRLREREITITIDDGFHSVFALACPILKSHGMVASIYITTYYVVHASPIFRIAIQYMAWKRAGEAVDVSGLLPGLAGTVSSIPGKGTVPLHEFYEKAESTCTQIGRSALLREFAVRSGTDCQELCTSRRLSLMSEEEIRELGRQGFDIQLHTHRHCLPPDSEGIAREIKDNRAVLQPLTPAPLVHFCYPSGLWSRQQWSALESLGIVSATTCVPGFNSRKTPRLALRRLLDAQDLCVHEFRAELFGARDVFRRAAGTAYRWWASPTLPTPKKDGRVCDRPGASV